MVAQGAGGSGVWGWGWGEGEGGNRWVSLPEILIKVTAKARREGRRDKRGKEGGRRDKREKEG